MPDSILDTWLGVDRLVLKHYLDKQLNQALITQMSII